MDALDLYLRRAAASPFVWGERDCALFVADWVAETAGVDAAATVRGRYGSLRGARRLLGGADADALVRFVSACAARAGLAPVVGLPARGDIGVVQGDVGAGCAICTGAGWALQGDRSVTIVKRGEALAAWSVRRG